VLRKIFGLQMDEVSEMFRLLSNEQLPDVCTLCRVITVRMREEENAYKILA
jgi:hypothetical protein